MQRRHFIASTALSTTVRWVASMGVAPCAPASPPSGEYSEYSALTEWLKKLMRSVNALAVELDEYRLTSYLTGLGNRLTTLRDKKRDILQFLTQKVVDRDKLKSVLRTMPGDVERLRQAIKEVSFPMKQAYADEGKRIADGLEETLLGRKAWVSQLQDTLSRGGSDNALRNYKSQVEQSANGLNDAIDQLAKVVRFHEAQDASSKK